MIGPSKLPSPVELHRMFERDEITREQLHASINVHAKALVDEIVEESRNPVAAYVEQLRNRRAAAKLIKLHGSAVVREILTALGNDNAFAMSGLLWNAGHEDVPIFCFLRTKHEPIFRVREILNHPKVVVVSVEYGRDPKALSRETLTMKRDWQGVLKVDKRVAE